MRLAFLPLAASLAALACSAPPRAASTRPTTAEEKPPGGANDPGRGAVPASDRPGVAAARSPEETAAAIFARVKPSLTACYEHGRKATPTMVDGKLTLHAAIDAAGKPTCVIPRDDSGLTQEVEDCMSARLADETLAATGAPRTAVIAVTVRSGSVQLGEAASSTQVTLDSVETHRMPDAFDTLEALVPELQACMQEIDRSAGIRAVTVAARVKTDGRLQCSLATTPSATTPLPPKVGACTNDVFRNAKFPPPKGGPGLVLVPISLGRG